MKRFPHAWCVVVILVLAWLVQLPAFAADNLRAVLARMDRDAPSFRGLTADVTMITYTKVLDDRATETGKLEIQKLGANNLRAVIAFTGADQKRTVALLGKMVKIYYPESNAYSEYDLGSQSQVANQLLLLGFGSSGSDLAKSYDIQFLGPDPVNGQPASKLELTPKDPNVQARVAKIDLWVPPDRGNPVQQQFFDPPTTGNWRKVTYGNIILNPPNQPKLDLVLPKNAKKISD